MDSPESKSKYFDVNAGNEINIKTEIRSEVVADSNETNDYFTSALDSNNSSYPVPISKLKPSSASGLLSSSVPTTRSRNFITDSSDKSEEEEEEDSLVGNDEKLRKIKYSVAEPIIYTSQSDSSSNSNSSLTISPTSVYATMLTANNIVSNSMNLLQAGTRLPNPPTLIEYVGLKFLIMDAPSQSNLHLYLKEMERVGVRDIVRICEPTYPREIVESAGIKVHDWVFPDGESPPVHVINSWLALVDSQKSKAPESVSTIAVHCVAGLGRAPVLVAIALIENGMRPLDAVMFIRQRRRGAINNKQLKFLENYQPRHSKKDKCIIM